jgi:hypothetical protein
VADQVLQEATVPVLLVRAARAPRRAARTHLALSSIFF